MVEPQIGVILDKKLCCGWVVVFSLKEIGLGLGLGCVIKSNCGCGCGWGHSSEVDCVVVVVVVVQFSFCSSLLRTSLFFTLLTNPKS